jgi:hypothetical protein
MRRGSLIGLASLATVAGTASLLGGATVASAAAPVVVTCNGFTASTTGAGTATGCNQPAVTKGKGTNAPGTGKTFSLKWASGLTTTGTLTYALVSPSKCPTTYPTEVKETSTVTGGTAKTLIGGKGTNTVCVSLKLKKVILLPGTKYKL